MEAFESLIGGLLRREGVWIYPGYHVHLTKAEKVEIGKPSHPRAEIDILGCRASSNQLLWIECKSYLDSPGVRRSAFDGSNQKEADGYKMFTDDTYRRVLSAALKRQVVQEGLLSGTPSIEFWLVAGKIALQSRTWLQQHFQAQGWVLRDRHWILEHLEAMSSAPYEDDVAMMVAKLLRPQP